MTFIAIEIPPGIVKTESPDAATGRWIDADHVRFVRGKPEKVGGTHRWMYEDSRFNEPARAAYAWGSYQNVQMLAFGTASKFFVYREELIYDRTPFRLDSEAITLTNPFSTNSGSPIVTVTDANHGIEAAGVVVVFSGATAVGGITINGEYTVTSIIGVNSYTITHTSNASSTAGPGGGTVTASYTLNPGDVNTAYLVGWGIGGWGEGYWGEEQSLADALISDPTNWTMDVYGEDLIINQVNGPIWYYDTSTNSRPTRILGAPTSVRAVFVTPERYIFALGCTTIAGNFDPMTVRWPDIEDITDWTPSEIDTSNERKLQGGTRLIAGIGLSDGISVVWSDTSLFVFQFTGSTSIYSSRRVSTDCGLVSPHAFTTANGAAFWISESNFWMFNGYTSPLPNVEDIRRWVFDRVNKPNLMKSFAFFNSTFNEVWFFLPVDGAEEPNLYVMVDLDNFIWTHGTWTRTAATIYTLRETRPILFGLDGAFGKAWQHEFSDYPDDDGEALPVHIELAPTAIEGGNRSVDIFGFVPDMQRQDGDFEMTIRAKDHPRGDDMMTDVLTFGPTEKLVDARVGGRQFMLKLSSDDANCDFRMGAWGLEIQGAGTKRGSQ